MPKVLFVCLHRPDRSPSQRFRFEQYLPFLRENGYECEFSYLLDADADKKFYAKGEYVKKAQILLSSIAKRRKEVRNAKKYDIVFVQRECFMLGTSYFERQFARKTHLIFDFDDSIWLQNVSAGNKALGFLKNADKTKEIIEVAHLVFAGNDYLASYARRFNKNVVIVPTTIDTDEYKPASVPKQDNRVCIGWSGSFTTIVHFEHQLEAYKRIMEKYGDKVFFKVIGDPNYRNAELKITGMPWKKDTEVADLQEMDLGIMPLPDDEWAKGKCGLKGLQYMAISIPTIMSPVGVNTEIVQDGENGLLASTTEEWVDKMSRLIDDAQLRKSMGDKGRLTCEKDFSIHANKGLYLKYFNQVLGR